VFDDYNAEGGRHSGEGGYEVPTVGKGGVGGTLVVNQGTFGVGGGGHEFEEDPDDVLW
jgi:hypothetical protein